MLRFKTEKTTQPDSYEKSHSLKKKVHMKEQRIEEIGKCIHFISFHLHPLPPENTALPSSLSQKDGGPPEHTVKHTDSYTQTA